MQTRKLAAATAAMTLMAAASAGAAERRIEIPIDGCTALAEIVYSQVTAVNWRYFRGGQPPGFVNDTERLVCRRTTRTVTRAFSRAMANMNVYFEWTTPERRRGDVCDSVDLSQCYPDRNPDMPSFSLGEAAYVINAWHAVRTTVLSTMQQGVVNDVSRFSAHAVAEQMNDRLNQASQKRMQHDRLPGPSSLQR